MKQTFKERLQNKLNYQQKIGLYRNPPEIKRRQGRHIYIDNKQCVNFSSNDYLGLGTSEILRQKVANNFQKYGTSASSSRLVSGNYEAIIAAEKAFAEYFGYPACLFYPSGYQANIGLISTLFEKEDCIFFDKHIHASSVKGMLLSDAAFCGFRHNSVSHLERRLNQHEDSGVSVVLTESLFSMDGDFADIHELSQCKQKHNLFFIVDEAHAFGAIGTKGRGIARPIADIAVGTFGKALGLFGAFVLCPDWVRAYLINFSSPLIYTTSLPEAHGASALDLVDILENSDDKREQLAHGSNLMKKMLHENSYQVKGDAHILSIEIGDEIKTLLLSNHLLHSGFLVFPARYPTVPLGQAIIRISMNAGHTEDDIKGFVHALKIGMKN